MELFSCTLRLNGSLYNEIPKNGVTGAEIALLRYLHRGENGTEAVSNIQRAGTVERTDAEERQRLAEIYNGAMKRFEVGEPRSVAEFFAASGPLPVPVETAGKVDVIAETPKRVSKVKASDQPPAPADGENTDALAKALA